MYTYFGQSIDEHKHIHEKHIQKNQNQKTITISISMNSWEKKSSAKDSIDSKA